MLYYTAMGFVSVIFHAYMVQHHTVHALFLLLLPLSVLNHAKYYEDFKGKGLVYKVDAFLASMIPIYGGIFIPKILSIYSCIFWLCLTVNAVIYPLYIYGQHHEKAFLYHGILHFNMIAGGHGFLSTVANYKFMR